MKMSNLKYIYASALLVLGTANAAPIVQTLLPTGVKRHNTQKLTVDQVGQLMFALIHARNIVAGISDDTLDPQPCQNGSLFYGEMPSGQVAYKTALNSLSQQGWKIQKEFRKESETAFQIKNGNVTALGLWLDVPKQKASALIMCEQKADWKPIAQATISQINTPISSPKLANSLIIQLSKWSGGSQKVRAILNPDGSVIGAGTVGTDGKMSLSLKIPTGAQLQPISKWQAAVNDIMKCDEGNFKGNISINNQNALIGSIVKIVPEKQKNGDDYLSAIHSDEGLTKMFSTPLIYTSAPVKIKGKLTCSSDDRNLDVDLNLLGGWTAVTLNIDLPDLGKTTQSLKNFDGHWSW